MMGMDMTDDDTRVLTRLGGRAARDGSRRPQTALAIGLM